MAASGQPIVADSLFASLRAVDVVVGVFVNPR
jgi:hypothetical protein